MSDEEYSDQSSNYDDDYDQAMEMEAIGQMELEERRRKEGPEFAVYDCLGMSDVEMMVNSLVVDLTSKVALTPSQAKLILHLNRWDVEKIREDYQKNVDEFLQKNGIKPPPPKAEESGVKRFRRSRSTSTEKCCGVCLEEDKTLTGLDCEHKFCTGCWPSYFFTQIQAGVCRIICMASGCRLYCPEEFIVKLLADDPLSRVKYEQQLFRDLVFTNPKLSWCPGPNCDVIVHSECMKPHRVECNKCKTQFCFQCCQAYHAPARCDIIRKWWMKCADDSETANYISANTKDCPKCHSPIEKNGGCNHIHCTKCDGHFCWICLQEWSTHGNNFYSCSRYDASRESHIADARKALERYLHYFRRYENHQKSLKLEEELRDKIKNRVEMKVANHEGTWIDWQYLHDAASLLTRCRYTLQFTYPFAYYLHEEADNKTRELFEYQQAQLEKEIEELSWRVERTETTDRGDLEKQMNVAEHKRRILLEDFFK